MKSELAPHEYGIAVGKALLRGCNMKFQISVYDGISPQNVTTGIDYLKERGIEIETKGGKYCCDKKKLKGFLNGKPE
jgi:hypothetical protein